MILQLFQGNITYFNRSNSLNIRSNICRPPLCINLNLTKTFIILKLCFKMCFKIYKDFIIKIQSSMLADFYLFKVNSRSTKKGGKYV